MEYRQGQKTYQHYYSIGDCEHAIADPAGRLEIGIVPRGDGHPGYSLMLDDMMFFGAIGKDGGKLKQEYAAALAIKQLRSEGYEVSRKVNAAGEIIISAN